MAVLVQTLIDQTRLLSNLKANQFFSDDDIGGFLSDAAMELADIFTDTYEHYFSTVQNFTLAGGVGANTVALNTDFEKATILIKDPDTNPVPVDPIANVMERVSDATSSGFRRRYYISGTPAVLEVLPPQNAGGVFRLHYTPQLGNIWTNTPATDALPVSLVPWQLFLKVHAAIAIVQGRKQPMPDGLQAKLEQQRARAVKLSANRSEGVTQAPITRGTRSWWDDWPGPGFG